VEAYARDHTHADFSHGICPECARALYQNLKDLGNPAESYRHMGA